MRLRKTGKVELLATVGLFQGLGKRELGEIAKVADEIDIPAGNAFIREGERGREFFALIDGTVEVRKAGRRVKLKGPADAFGEMALLTGAPRSATVTATSPVRALVITDRAFSQLLRTSPTLQTKLLRALAERLGADEPV